MRSKLIYRIDGQRTFVVVFDTGDEAVQGIHEFALAQRLNASQLTAIGAFESAILGYFEWERKTYERIELNEQVEVLSLTGNIVLEEGKPKVHAHVVASKRDGSAHGGHLIEAHVRPTLEVMIVESPVHLRRHHDEASGLALIRLD